MTLSRRLFAEMLGTALLLAIVVGSGIMAERLAAGNAAVALLANAVATGAGLFVLIILFAPISGAHFNPLVSLNHWRVGAPCVVMLCYIVAQCVGGVLGVALTHAMFELPFPFWSEKIRTGWGQWLSESVASFGLLFLLLRLREQSLTLVAACVGLYITAAYWFTASTSFANPAVTLARSFSNTFAGIQLYDVWPFVLAQLAGLVAAQGVNVWLGESLDTPHSPEP